SRVRERRTHGSVRGLRREPLVYSTVGEKSANLFISGICFLAPIKFFILIVVCFIMAILKEVLEQFDTNPLVTALMRASHETNRFCERLSGDKPAENISSP
ncbi:MAG: hypothetical protein K2N73_06675, partial [Lachnospiraceae bacterium]|nr:hypothetical protein [Lachnospiraceae bacterium]